MITAEMEGKRITRDSSFFRRVNCDPELETKHSNDTPSETGEDESEMEPL